MRYDKLSISDSGYIFMNGKSLNAIFEKIHGSNNFFEWLVPSFWIEQYGELDYISDLIQNHISCNFPLLVCGDDLDLSCTVIVVKTVYFQNTVLWSKFGSFSKPCHNYCEVYKNSGIRAVENWSEKDWELFGSDAFDLINDDFFFQKWCSRNWKNEVYRRSWGYYHKYLNDDCNINWFGNLNFSFDIDSYSNFFVSNLVNYDV